MNAVRILAKPVKPRAEFMVIQCVMGIVGDWGMCVRAESLATVVGV